MVLNAVCLWNTLYLFADTGVEVGDPPVEGAHVTQELGSQLPTDRLGGRTRITSRTNAPEYAGRPVGREPARDAAGDQV
jgi:hypothetical protein